MSNGGDGGSHGPETMARRLDGAYARWLDSLTSGQTSAIRAWQREDRHYDAIQAPLRGLQTSDDTVLDELQHLGVLTESARLPLDVAAWKGIRSVQKMFGVPAGELGRVRDRWIPYAGFFAVSLTRQVAVDEFTVPPGPPGAALLDLWLPEGTPAAWIAAAGDPRLRYQFELLLPPRIWVRPRGIAYPVGENELPVIDVEVDVR